MSLITTSRDELMGRSGEAFTRVRDLIGDAPIDVPVNDGAWSVGDVARHLVSGMRHFNAASWSASVRELTARNDADVDALAGSSRTELLDALDDEWGRYSARDFGDASVPYHFGTAISGFGVCGILLGELLVHGRDVATAVGRPWPIDDRDALLVLNGALQMAPGMLDSTRTATVHAVVEMRIRDGRPQLVVVDRGRCRVGDASPSDGRRDVVVGGPAAPILLNLYQRIGLVAATRRGVLVRGGRRPWLIVPFGKWFVVP